MSPLSPGYGFEFMLEEVPAEASAEINLEFFPPDGTDTMLPSCGVFLKRSIFGVSISGFKQ